MTNLEQQIAFWHAKRYGPFVNVSATYRKLLEEVGELAEAMMEHSPDHIAEEVGDVAMCLAHIIRGACPAKPSLNRALEAALDKCERRLHAKKSGGKKGRK